MKKNTPSCVNALNLIGSKVSKADILKTEEMLKINFGVNYPKEKFTLLWKMILEEGWTDYRLQETVKYFLKNKKYPNWTIADWFDYGENLYNYHSYLEHLEQNSKLNEQIVWYKVNDVRVWKFDDGVNLPFERA